MNRLIYKVINKYISNIPDSKLNTDYSPYFRSMWTVILQHMKKKERKYITLYAQKLILSSLL